MYLDANFNFIQCCSPG
uniref:Uncharacterized protein n=1 Tax=Anguilla anguilla TaxID=7936 RepID=A0A0E9QUK9_ANGAN